MAQRKTLILSLSKDAQRQSQSPERSLRDGFAKSALDDDVAA